MNNYELRLFIKTSTPAEREQLLEEIKNKPMGDKYCCNYFSCGRIGKRNISFCVNMRGGITDEVLDLLGLPQEYPNVTIEAKLYNEVYLDSHRMFYKDTWEEIMTVDDIIYELQFYSKFSPNMLDYETFREIYDYNGSLISEKRKKIPFPINKVSDDLRKGYEEWKKQQ